MATVSLGQRSAYYIKNENSDSPTKRVAPQSAESRVPSVPLPLPVPEPRADPIHTHTGMEEHTLMYKTRTAEGIAAADLEI